MSFCQVLTIIPRGLKRVLRIGNRTSIKIDYVTLRAAAVTNLKIIA
jgi:hypothetical protein